MENVSWQSIFLLNLPVAAVAVVVTLFATHESRDETAPRVDRLRRRRPRSRSASPRWSWRSSQGNRGAGARAGSSACWPLAVVGLVAFAVVETRVANPMVDFKFFRSRSFAGANMVAFIVSFAMLATFFFFALYLQNVRGYSPLQTGVRFLPTTVVIIFVGPIAGRLSDKIGPRAADDRRPGPERDQPLLAGPPRGRHALHASLSAPSS